MTTQTAPARPGTVPPAGGFGVLHVANDDDAILAVHTANAPHSGRLAVSVRPGARRSDWLSRDLLAALGVELTATGQGRNAAQNLQLLPVRLTVRRITDILIGRAELLTPALLLDLVLVAAAAGVRLWLVTSPPVTDALTAAVDSWYPTPVTVEEAAHAWPGLTDDAPAALQPASGPATTHDRGDLVEPLHLPLVDATTLLAACATLLPDQEAAWVRDRVITAVADAEAEALLIASVATGPGAAEGRRPDLLDERLGRWLLVRYDRAGTLAQFLCDVRGLQVAGLWRGLLIQVDVPTLLGTASGAPSAAARTPQVWDRLLAYRLPVRGAVCALAAARLGTADMRALAIADVAPDGSTVSVAGTTMPVEAPAARFLAEQRLLRLAAGAPGDARLLVTSTGTPMTDKGIARLLSDARTELGVVVTSRLVERHSPDGATVLRRWGVTVTGLGDPVPGRPDLTAHRPDPVPDNPRPHTSTTNADETARMDVELIRTRKVELRLSRGQIARRLGVTTATVTRLESGDNHAEQPLGLLLRLAAVLEVDIADLLPRNRGAAVSATDGQLVSAAPRNAVPDGPAGDVATVGAALHTVGVLVPVEALATTLGWTASRLASALTGLQATAPQVGLRVHRLDNRVSLVRAVDALPAQQLAAMLRHHAARAGLTTTQGRLVHAALTRMVAPATSGRGGHHMLARSNTDQVAAAALAGAGVLTTDANGDLRLTDDAALSLLLPTALTQEPS